MKSAAAVDLSAERQAAVFLLLAGVLLALVGLLPLLNLLGLGLFFAVLAFHADGIKSPAVRQLVWLTAVVLGVLLATYRPAHFEYPLIASARELHAGGGPFQLYLNFGKALAGLMVIAFLIRSGSVGNPPLRSPGAAAAFVLGNILLVIFLATAALDLSWQPKLPAMTVYFVLINLAVTSLSEEAFFRLLLQKHMMGWFESPRLALAVPAIVAAVLFALVHHPALDAVFVVFLGAGLSYALVYALTGRLLWAVAVHGGVNITHFLLLPYPLPLN